MARLPKENVGRLKLKWAFGVLGATGMFAQPTVVGGRIFFGSQHGKVYSHSMIHAASSTFDADFASSQKGWRSTDQAMGWGRRTFGDDGSPEANVYAVDAANGRLLWKTRVDGSPYSHITGAPVLQSGKLYVPVTGRGTRWPSIQNSSCVFRGSLVALDAQTGQQLWKSFTIPERARTLSSKLPCTPQWGPSGAGRLFMRLRLPWEKRAIYVATGDSHTYPAASTSDAILAFDMDSGAQLWWRQNDTGGCVECCLSW